MQVNHNDTFGRWLLMGMPLLRGVGVLSALVVHLRFDVPVSRIFAPVAAVVLIQLTTYIPMFWIRRRFRRTHDPRPAIALVGAYCLTTGLVLLHYSNELKIFIIHRYEYAALAAVVFVATLVVLAVSPKWSIDE